jgi:coenzyme Q-binding protein COQ10
VTQHYETRSVPYSADLMYQIVADVERYPQFLPWVLALRILSRQDNILSAEMVVGYGPLRERYISRVTLDPVAHTIDVIKQNDAADKSPFRQLENHWRFTPEGDGCKINFSIAFVFRSALLQTAAGKAFSRVMLQMTNAFEARAASLTQAPH